MTDQETAKADGHLQLGDSNTARVWLHDAPKSLRPALLRFVDRFQDRTFVRYEKPIVDRQRRVPAWYRQTMGALGGLYGDRVKLNSNLVKKQTWCFGLGSPDRPLSRQGYYGIGEDEGDLQLMISVGSEDPRVFVRSRTNEAVEIEVVYESWADLLDDAVAS